MHSPSTRGLMVVSEGSLDPDQYLGRIAFYSLPDDERKMGDLIRSWSLHGLDPDRLPDNRQPVHIFQSACSSVKRREREHGDRVEIRADEVENKPGRCAYQITLAKWDTSQRVIEHEKAMRVTFDKSTCDMTFDALGQSGADLQTLAAQIRDDYLANEATITGNKIRHAIREQLLAVGAVNLRRRAGGVYFVPAVYDGAETGPLLTGLAGVLEDLYGDDAELHQLPCANDETEKAMVRRHFNLTVAERAEKLTLKLTDRVRQGRGRGVRPELIASSMQEYRQIKGAIRQFKDLVQAEEQDLAANIADMEDALAALDKLAGVTA